MPPPKKNHVLIQTDFDRLLVWLGEGGNREQGALQYEQIRRRLIVIFAGRDCLEPEELADATIDRVARKITEIEKTYEGEKARYFYGVANYIYQEYLKRKPLPARERLVVEKGETDEARFECLEKCLAKLSGEARELVIGYYAENKQAKIDFRKALAEKFDLSGNALRHRIRRLKLDLKKCVEKCLRE